MWCWKWICKFSISVFVPFDTCHLNEATLCNNCANIHLVVEDPPFFMEDSIGSFRAPLLHSQIMEDLQNVLNVQDRESNWQRIIDHVFCFILQLFGKIIYNRVYNSTHNLVSPYQHVFVAKRRTMTNLTFMQQVFEHLSNREDSEIM